MANRQSQPPINTRVNRGMISSQMQQANMQSPWRAPDFGPALRGAAQIAGQYYNEEKKAALQRYSIEAQRLQDEEREAIRVAGSAEDVVKIENDFKARINNDFSQDYWGKQWLAENGETFLALNNRDVQRWGLENQKERTTVEMDKTLNSYATEISNSAPDKAKALIGNANLFIDQSGILSPAEKQKSKDNFTNLAFERLAQNNPNVALNLLKDGNLTKSLGIDAKAKINDIIKKQFAEIEFQDKVKRFNNERELAEKLDDMPTDEALRYLEQNEGNVSSKFFKAKQDALLSAKGITAETKADTMQDILMDIATLDRGNVEKYYAGSMDLVDKIENAYASGELSLADRKTAIRQVYNGQKANLEALKESDAGSKWRFWGYSYKDAADDIAADYTGNDGNKILLDYFRKINDGAEYDTDQKKAILQGLITQANANDLSLPSFADMDEAKAAYEAGKIKKGDKVYINGVKGTI